MVSISPRFREPGSIRGSLPCMSVTCKMGFRCKYFVSEFMSNRSSEVIYKSTGLVGF